MVMIMVMVTTIAAVMILIATVMIVIVTAIATVIVVVPGVFRIAVARVTEGAALVVPLTIVACPRNC